MSRVSTAHVTAAALKAVRETYKLFTLIRALTARSGGTARAVAAASCLQYLVMTGGQLLSLLDKRFLGEVAMSTYPSRPSYLSKV